MEHYVGLFASSIAFIMFIPSAMAVWKNRHDKHALRGSSVVMNALLILNALSWGLYGYLTQAFWVAAPGFVNLPLAVVSIVLILRSRYSKEEEPAVPPLYEPGDRVFITAPPGWGSIVGANEGSIRHGIVFRTEEELERLRALHRSP